MLEKWILSILFLLIFLPRPCLAAANLTEPENPATLAFSETRFTLILPKIFFNADNNLFNPENINADLTTSKAKQEFLDRLNHGEFSGELSTSFKTGVTIGHWSVYLRPWFSSTLNLKSGVPELIFNGYEAGKNYEINGSKGQGVAAGALDISYGRQLWSNENSKISAGLTLHYLRGLAVGQGEILSNSLTTDEWGQASYNVDVDYSYGVYGDNGFHGEGFLADLGFLYQTKPWELGLMINNIGPALQWSGLTHEIRNYTGAINGGPEGPELPEPESTTITNNATSLTTRIPLLIHLYSGYHLKDSLQWNFGLKKGVRDAWGITTAPLAYTGLDWQPVPAFGATGNFYYHKDRIGVDTAFRFKVKVLLLNLGVGWSGRKLSPNESSALNFSFATGLQF